MKKIFIGKTKFLPFDFTIVDDHRYEELNQWRWHTDNKGYVVRRVRRNGKKLVVYMHRVVADTPQGMVTDHINGLVTDNREENLRVCTDAENKRNRGRTQQNTSGLKGVYWHKQIGRWYSRIMVDNKDKYLGTFDTPEEAHLAYTKASKKLHGKFARVN